MNKITSEFIGLQTAGDEKLRFYNVVGEHRLKGSTVTVDTLVKEGIEIPDLTKEEIEEELKRIERFMGGN